MREYYYLHASVSGLARYGLVLTEAWVIRRLITIFKKCAKRPHVPRDAGVRELFSRSGIPTPSSRGTSLNCELYARSISRQINKPGCPSHPGSAASADEDPDDSDESSSEVSDDDDDELSDAEGGESEEGVASDTELPNDAFMCVSHAALLLRLQSTPHI